MGKLSERRFSQVAEVDAFSSVHDMIHAAINSYGAEATLRQVWCSFAAVSPQSASTFASCLMPALHVYNLQVYQACEERGRIAYKRSGGSRLITHNDHWKSQIRHALYTCDRFKRYVCSLTTSQYMTFGSQEGCADGKFEPLHTQIALLVTAAACSCLQSVRGSRLMDHLSIFPTCASADYQGLDSH